MDASPLDADRIIADLGLVPHPEGGWYRETWRDGAGTAILYLLRDGERSAWHRVRGRAEVWHFCGGAPLTLRTAPDAVAILGDDLSRGQQPQVVVPPGAWQCAETAGGWSLVGTTMAPAFDFAAFELASPAFDTHTEAAGTSNVSNVTSAPDSDSPTVGDIPTGATAAGGVPDTGNTTAGSGQPPADTRRAVVTVTVTGDASEPISGATTATVALGPQTPGQSEILETLSIDIGGTGLEASVLDATGEMERDRVRVDTPYPLAPEKLVHVLTDLVRPLGRYDRVSVGFPGMVRAGLVLSAPHFVSPAGPGGVPTTKLTTAWARFDLQSALANSLGKPTKVANDADLQGSAVVDGHGLELVVTLGTGVGTALFYEGKLLPHLEFAHHAFRKDQTYNEALGDAVRKQLGTKKWNKRVAEMIDVLRALTFFDHLYIGGGNSARVDLKLDKDVTLVDNSAGILGGIKLWHRTA